MELRKLVHAVVNDGSFIHLPGEGWDRHRIVKPLHRRCEVASNWFGQKRLKEPAPLLVDPSAIAPTRRRNFVLDDEDIGVIGNVAHTHGCRRDFCDRSGCFDEKNSMAFGKTRQELLRPLPYPIPIQMRVDDDRIIAAALLMPRSKE